MKKKPSSLFKSYFSFFKDVDITNDAKVLLRRNQVIRNIITISNLAFTLILMISAISTKDSSNFLLSLLLFPVSYIFSNTLKMLMYKDENSLVKQETAMYVACIYIFAMSVIVYIRINKYASFFSGAAYLLLYYSLLVMILYQNKQLIKNMVLFILFAFTFVHFTITHDILAAEYSKNVQDLLRAFLTESELHDIILRTIILIIFLLVSHSLVDTSNYLHEKRKEDLLKRKDVEENFKKVVKDIFNVVITNNVNYQDNKKYIDLVADLSKKLASYMNLSLENQQIVYDFAKCHINSTEKLEEICNSFSDNLTDDEFYRLKDSTEEGAMIVKRLQLSQKCEDIIKAHMEDVNSSEFVKNINKIQDNEVSDIILFAELYVSLRSPKSYKRPFSHKIVVDILKNRFNDYYDIVIFERFYKNNKEFEDTYNMYC